MDSMTTDPARIGLCFRCIHARIVRTTRSVFWRCGLSDTDPRFARYPRLPVLECDGFVEGPREGESVPGADPAGESNPM
jgi:hypothetical protein